MSQWNVKKKRRRFIIVVKEILSREEDGPAGLPMIEILDGEGRKHLVTALDMPSWEFKRIEPGAKIILTLEESIIRAEVKAKP